jgi:hypothetical protein
MNALNPTYTKLATSLQGKFVKKWTRQPAVTDHTHAVITAAAMKRGKHVYTQMPLAHDAWEIRLGPVLERSYHPS